MGRVTILAACLDQLGGLVDEDPPLLVLLNDGIDDVPAAWSVYDDVEPLDGAHILLPQSAPALLRVLARHTELELKGGETPAWTNANDGDGWRLVTLLGWQTFCGRDVHRWSHIPTLTLEMSPMRALAEAFVWLARVARVEHPDHYAPTLSDVLEPLLNDLTLASLLAAEKHMGLPKWRAEVAP